MVNPFVLISRRSYNPAIATDNCFPSLFSSTCNGGTKNSPIAEEGPTKKCFRLNDQICAYGYKVRAEKSKNLHEKIIYEFHIFRVFKRGI